MGQSWLVETPHWPLFGLRVRSPKLEMRYVDDELAMALAELAALGIHAPDTMPFSVPWSDVPSPQLERNTLLHLWRVRASHEVDDWHLPFAALVDGEVVGTMSLLATRFALLRSVRTGSWIGRAFHRRGFATEMRSLLLHLGFVGLDAVEATSGAFADNVGSLRVSEKLGYRANGSKLHPQRDKPGRIIELLLPRADWEVHRRDDIVIHGLEPCLEMLISSA